VSATAADEVPGACSGEEVFALRVIGDDMAPEFNDGDIIIVEPGGALRDGRYVLAWHSGEWFFRQLRRRADRWTLCALAPQRPELALASLEAVRGVVIQKAVPGRRRLGRTYV
jgi:phage repressor protein C with HTH and peptisase S24 domain